MGQATNHSARTLNAPLVLQGPLRARIENETFFASRAAPHGPPPIAEAVFYAGRLRPPPETPVAVRGAATPLRYAAVIFLLGWAGILFQAGFLQQVVFGAPVFEELAKLGPALLVAAMLGTRSMWIRLPLALVSGAAFGVMEHYVTYADEPIELLVQRIAFHSVSPGLSMLVYGAFESMPDVRARWASTIPATLFHWANNFGAVVLSFASIFLPISDAFIITYAALITSGMVVLVGAGILARRAFEDTARRAIDAAMPRLGLAPRGGIAEERSVDNV